MKLTDAEIEYTRQVAAEIGADPEALIAEGEQLKAEAYQGAYEASAEILGGGGRRANVRRRAGALPGGSQDRTGTGGGMTCRVATPEEIKAADAAARQWWLSVLTLGLIPRPEPELEIEI
jgi:hypothetical protein